MFCGTEDRAPGLSRSIPIPRGNERRHPCSGGGGLLVDRRRGPAGKATTSFPTRAAGLTEPWSRHIRTGVMIASSADTNRIHAVEGLCQGDVAGNRRSDGAIDIWTSSRGETAAQQDRAIPKADTACSNRARAVFRSAAPLAVWGSFLAVSYVRVVCLWKLECPTPRWVLLVCAGG